jgi:uncharacterized repeat protein (TIGR02543 family)
MYKISMIVMMSVLLNAGCLYAASYTWKGGTGDWATASNWLRNGVTATAPPGIGDDVTINTGTPTISGTSVQDCNNLIIDSGAGLILNYLLRAYGNVTNNGTITGSSALGVGSSPGTSIQGTGNFNNLTTNGTCTVNLLSDIVVHDLSISGGAATGTINANNYNITVNGNWDSSGDAIFNPGNGTVIFNGTNQTIKSTGYSPFNNLTKVVSSADTLSFDAFYMSNSALTNVKGTLTLKGEFNNLLSLRSTTSDTQWKINAQGTRDLQYLDVKDSANLSTSPMIAKNSVDSGNNTNWTFISNPTVTTTVATAVAQTTATAGGNITSDGGDTVTAKGVCYGTAANPAVGGGGSACVPGTAGAASSFTANLTGLTPGTQYHIRAYATNTAGTGYGSDLTFTTTADTFTVSFAAGTGGTVSPPADQTVASGGSTPYPVTAIGNTGYTFDQWRASPSGVCTFTANVNPLTVTNVTGNVTLTASFKAVTAPPTISNVTPSSGPAAGGTSVTITGTNFIAGTISVLFGGTAANCSNDTASPTTKLNCTTPRHAAGVVDVVVTVSEQPATKTGGFTYTEITACSALTADFTATPTTGLKPLTVNFDAAASAGAASYSWDFGDYGSTDNTATGVTASHIYASSGIYEVTLTITDSIGRYTATATKSITVMEIAGCTTPSTASFTATPLTGNVPLIVQYDASGSSSDVTSFSWNFGDDHTGTGAYGSHTYSKVGTYYMKLDATGCSTASSSKYITVTCDAAPTITADKTSGNLPLTVNFTAGGTGTNPTWNFADSASGSLNTASGTSVSHTFNSSGYYDVTLTTSGYDGCTKIVSTRITVGCDAIPKITANPTSGNLPLTVSFTSVGTGSNPTWNFGDSASGSSNTASGTSTSHTYNAAGRYYVSLTTTGTNSCSGYASTYITVSTYKTISLPSSLSFGNVYIGTNKQQTFSIYNSGNTPLTVSSISYPAGFAGDWSGGTIAAGSSKSVNVTFIPTAAQSYSGTVTVISDKTGGTNTMPISGTGVVLPQPYNAASEFSATNNPNGAWSYGYSYGRGGFDFDMYSSKLPTNSSIDRWMPYSWYSYPAIMHNAASTDVTLFSSALLKAGKILLHPGDGKNSVLRWTAPVAGEIKIDAIFVGLDSRCPPSSDAAILHKSTELWSASINTYNVPLSVSKSLTVQEGDFIDFTVGDGGNGYYNDWTGLDVSISYTAIGSGFTVSFQAGSGGTVSGTTLQTVSNGGSCTSVTAVPDSGYQFSSWTGTGGFTSTANPLIVANVTGNMAITANFTPYSDYPYVPTDYCPDDPNKTEPGVCGCGVSDIDSDGDGVPDCNDKCPKDPNKTEPGKCGCGVAETETCGKCPAGSLKTEPGICGCNVADTDTDKDGVPDCNDKCPNDPKKTEPGKCGCGVAETETCGKCPVGSLKTEPGICGCNVADTDTDKDGVPDCNDKCPNDPKKTEQGICGCGVAETETCGKCPVGSLKTDPGICGCNVADTDTDKDGVPDCNDKCPNDPKKTEQGICGCGIPDTDSAGDGITDCLRADPPEAPRLLSPKLQAIITQGPVTLAASSFSAPGNQTHTETHWLIQRADMLYRVGKNALFDDHTVTSGDMTGFGFADISAGLKYIWKAGYKGSGNSKISWSEKEFSFIVGTPEQSPIVEIPAGDTAAQYQMFSIPYWMPDEDATAVLGAIIGAYNTKMFRIGTFDANTGGYIEYGEGMKIIPGRAYWILARNGVKISVSGVPVSLNHVLEVILDNGWNMVSAPNNADYDWSKVEVMVYDDNLKVIYGPAVVSAGDSQKYLDTLWQWQNGDYVSANTLEKNKGYWVKAKQSGVVLRFPESARGKSAARSEKRSDSAEKPPMPMENTAFDISTGSADAAGGCFIDSAAQK